MLPVYHFNHSLAGQLPIKRPIESQLGPARPDNAGSRAMRTVATVEASVIGIEGTEVGEWVEAETQTDIFEFGLESADLGVALRS